MNLIQKYRAWKNAINPAPITLHNIWRVVRAFFRRRASSVIPKHITEQAAWRLTRVRKECLKNGACIYCGCDIKELVWEDDQCEGRPTCYPRMMSEKEWALYKKVNKTKTK